MESFSEFGERCIQAGLDLRESLALARRVVCEAALKAERGNQCRAARTLRVARDTMRRIAGNSQVKRGHRHI